LTLKSNSGKGKSRPARPKNGPPETLLTRRKFLRLSGCAIGAGLAGWMLWPQPAAAGVLPPGALPLADFEAACIRCGKCGAICDQRAIELGFDGIPLLQGINGWCDFCMDCVAVCPSGALRPVDPEAASIGTAIIDRDRCIAWQWVGCRLCYEKCAKLQKAISLDEDWRPHVDDSLCNGCGACVFVCPQPAREAGSKRKGKAVSLTTTASLQEA
jgi:ferredoxin-type protein NapF